MQTEALARSSRRRWPRAIFTGPVEVFDWNRPRRVTPRDLGGGGIFVACDDPLPEGRLLTLRLGLPDRRRPITILGRVVRSVCAERPGLKRAGMGIRFEDLRAGERDRILAYVADRAP